jgi:hypothetical protein
VRAGAEKNSDPRSDVRAASHLVKDAGQAG